MLAGKCVKMHVALKTHPLPPALGAAFDIRVHHRASFEAGSWRIHPAPADTSQGVNLLFAFKLKQCHPPHRAPLWGNNNISILGLLNRFIGDKALPLL